MIKKKLLMVFVFILGFSLVLITSALSASFDISGPTAIQVDTDPGTAVSISITDAITYPYLDEIITDLNVQVELGVIGAFNGDFYDDPFFNPLFNEALAKTWGQTEITLSHYWDLDVGGDYLAPSGETWNSFESIILWNGSNNASQMGEFDVTFDDDASVALISITGDAYGDVLPYESLSAFYDNTLYGEWALTFTDIEGYPSHGTDLLSWSMTGETADSEPVPEPATMLLLGVGILGLAGFRRRFKQN